ncbi:MAG: O-antigen ligase family protein [Candidatus Magasanikbacteria bacterium]|nr:O-antigen ligase family protein [Candidatus Magasanikbacteria bacterium]
MKEKYLLWGIKILVYASFIMPLIVMGETFIFPFVFPKAIYFRVLVELMLGLYVLLCILNKDYLPRNTPLTLSVLFWLFALFLASIFGTDFIRSFWGNYERMSGWYTLAHFAVYFLIVTSIFKTWGEWKWLLRWSLLWSLFVGLTGLNFLLSDKSIMKIGGGGSLGNQIYLANFVLFFVFIAWYLFRKEEKKVWKFLSALYIVVGVGIMMYNGKRGPFIGLLAGVFVAAFLSSLFTKIKKWRVIGLSIFAILIVCGGLIFAFRQTDFVGNLPAIGPIARISLSSGTAETRLIAWNIAWQAFKERPVFGWGLENFYYAFNKYYNPVSLEHGYYETWFDRSHNIFLDYLSTSGLIGFVSYLGFFAVCGWVVIKRFRQSAIQLDDLVFFTIFLVGYAVQNFFVFDHLSSYLVFFFVFSLINFFDVDKKNLLEKVKDKISQKVVPSKTKTTLSWGPVLGIGVITVFLIYTTNVLPARANKEDFQTQMLMQKDFGAGFSKMKDTMLINSFYVVDLRNDFSRAIISYAQNLQVAQTPVFKEAAQFIVTELEKTMSDHPLELQTLVSLSQYYGLFGNLNKAEELLIKARELSPKRQQVAYLLVRVKVMKKDYQGAINLLEQTIKDDAKIPDSYWYLTLIYMEVGDAKRSYDNLKLSVQYGKDFTLQESLLGGNIAKQNNDWLLSKTLFELALSKDQKNVSALLGLSEIYSKLGDKEKAKEMADRAALYDAKASEESKKWLK